MNHTTIVSTTKVSMPRWLFRPRFTLRTLLVAVVAIAVVVACWKRADRLTQMATKHAAKAGEYAGAGWGIQRLGGFLPEHDADAQRFWRLHEEHRDFSTRCQQAVWRPWVSICNEPPPEPEK